MFVFNGDVESGDRDIAFCNCNDDAGGECRDGVALRMFVYLLKNPPVTTAIQIQLKLI